MISMVRVVFVDRMQGADLREGAIAVQSRKPGYVDVVRFPSPGRTGTACVQSSHIPIFLREEDVPPDTKRYCVDMERTIIEELVAKGVVEVMRASEASMREDLGRAKAAAAKKPKNKPKAPKPKATTEPSPAAE